jgi:hypothetical protein
LLWSLTCARPVCDGDAVFRNRPDGLPDGSIGIVGAFVACAAGATLAVEVGFDAGASALLALAAALLLSTAIKIAVDMRTGKILKAIADGDMEVDDAPDAIRTRLSSQHHRETLSRTLRRIAEDASRYPRPGGRLAAPPMIVHLEPETRGLLVHLADVLAAPTPLEPRGVAIVEDLVTSPASPVFGPLDDDIQLEIRRALFILGVD